MMRGVSIAALAAAVGLLAATTSSDAALINIVSQDVTDFAVNPTLSNPGWVSQSGTVAVVAGSVGSVYRSPFENAATPGSGVGNWASLPYISVQGNSSATFFAGFPANTLTILWGSPDSYNTLAFYATPDGTGPAIATFSGSDLVSPPSAVGHNLVTFQGATFLSVVLTSQVNNAFEFAGLEASFTREPPGQTPLPGALPLFSAGAAVIGLAGWRKKRKAKTAA